MAKPPVPPSKKIDSTFRNGSITVIGVILAFSLGFLNNWAFQDGPWTWYDIVAVVLITTGIGCQIRTVAGLLSPASLDLPIYKRLVLFFIVGLTLMSAGILLALAGDIIAAGTPLLHH